MDEDQQQHSDERSKVNSMFGRGNKNCVGIVDWKPNLKCIKIENVQRMINLYKYTQTSRYVISGLFFLTEIAMIEPICTLLSLATIYYLLGFLLLKST